MKHVLTVMVTLGVLATCASAAQVEFVGGVCIASITPICQSDGYSVGSCSWSRYNPPNIGDNPPSTGFTFLDFRGAQNYTLPSGSLIGTTYQPVTSTFVYRVGAGSAAQMRITKQSPSDLTGSDFVSLTGNIRDFDIGGCNIQLKFSGVRREIN